MIRGLASLIPLLFATSAYSDILSTDPYFDGQLKLLDVAEEFEDIDSYDLGHTEFELLESFAYFDGEGREWRVPKGTVVNGASIPKVVWSWVGGPWSGKYRKATVVHDWMCDELLSDSNDTHAIFYEAMLASDVSELKAWVMYQAVLRGGPQWENSGFGPSVLPRKAFAQRDLDKLIQEAKQLGMK